MIVGIGGEQRKRGRPRTRCLDCIEDTGLALQELVEVTRNRTEWRETVMMVTGGRLAT